MIRLVLCRALAAAAVSICLIPVACAGSPSSADESTSSVDDGGISVHVDANANCPTSVAVNQSVALKSSVRYQVTNSGSSARNVLIVEEVSDGEDHTARSERSVRVPARSSISDRATPRAVLRATYATPRVVVITTSLTISDPESGNVYADSSSSCSISVE
ncbi:MAG: hypothetical protein QM820_34795 [Minicystis sp.]